MKEYQKNIIRLLRSSLDESPVTLPADFDWSAAERLAAKHQMIPMLYYGALHATPQPPQELMQRLEEKTFQYVAISEKQLHELACVEKLLEENAVDYIPLKGAVLKQQYPKTELRTMSDIDILIRDEQRDVFTPLMKRLGYKLTTESDHELIWCKKNVLWIELHKRLIPSYNKDYYAYYGDGWRLAQTPCTGSSQYSMRPEDQLIYLIVHFAKHYRDSGIGIRHLIDLYVFQKRNPGLDTEYIDCELQRLQLTRFTQNIRRTIAVWFEDAQTDEMTDFLTDKIFNSGLFGSAQGHVFSAAVKDAKTESICTIRTRRAIRMVFPTYKDMKIRYPFLRKFPPLLPVLWGVRWFTAIFIKKNAINLQKNRLRLITAQNIERYQSEMCYVGLDIGVKDKP